MEFSRTGDNSIRCLISEEEIVGLGYTLDELLGNTDKTQEFINRIFDIADREYGFKMESGLKTVRADFLPNHIISLTFSESAAQQKVNGFMEHLMNYVNEMLGISKDKLQDLKDTAAKEKVAEQTKDATDAPEPKIIVLLAFQSMHTLCQFAKNVSMHEIPDNILYKYGDVYYLVIDLSDQKEDEVLRFSVLTDEYASHLLVGSDKLAFMREHAEVILPNHAIESLKQI